MKFIILVKATADSEAGQMPSERLLAEMGAFHEEMAKAGVLVDGTGLKPSKTGWRIKYAAGGKRALVDGPFVETKELVAGFTVIDVKSRKEALAWSMRFPNPSIAGGDAEIEVREYFALEDFGESPAVERMKTFMKE